MGRKTKNGVVTAQIMVNLEVKNKMSVAQFAILVTAAMFGGQIIGLPSKLVPQAEQFAWVSIILGGGLFFAAAWLMLKLGELYPDCDYTEYLPRLLGKWPGLAVIGGFIGLFLIVSWANLSQFSQALTFFMFDRTPSDVVIMGMLGVVVYCALQDLGTIIRVVEFNFFVATLMMGTIWLLGIFNFQPENMLPFWTDKPLGMVKGAIDIWGVYGGYEIILLFFPLINKEKGSLTLALAAAIAFVVVTSVIIVVFTVGVLTVEGVKSESYPTLVVVRSVELPGTFIERLENYLLVAWIPSIFKTLAIFVYICSQTLAKLWGFADHRPWVLALTPVIFTGATLLNGPELMKLTDQVLTWLGLALSVGIMPVVYLLAKRRRRSSVR
ncbi:GerAB/ArcD/ProY family transporter [Sporomusa acidovorans]|uniref:Spore germination protein YndE n=1 Tax=Sporomusa acidovorans (strain ATCC 49682 / DSM 3132 / Mol) TaxID=1123286 RepID=A0ABZ3IX79_SPOA4|nr:GerAB/ArcD/ProY family transporter [Sporomusa acidovorans]OZC23678.1 spore germination protein YndE [Sporomusa acidovorans DSM 3132]SDE24919.1 spore germination protein [Sporomusa acidovorans]